MSAICVITARGGSKRIPKKNIKEFCGKPIIAYSIEAALESEMFDEVMVSTDDSEIAEVAEEYGATVPFMRSKKMFQFLNGLIKKTIRIPLVQIRIHQISIQDYLDQTFCHYHNTNHHHKPNNMIHLKLHLYYLD